MLLAGGGRWWSHPATGSEVPDLTRRSWPKVCRLHGPCKKLLEVQPATPLKIEPPDWNPELYLNSNPPFFGFKLFIFQVFLLLIGWELWVSAFFVGVKIIIFKRFRGFRLAGGTVNFIPFGRTFYKAGPGPLPVISGVVYIAPINGRKSMGLSGGCN